MTAFAIALALLCQLFLIAGQLLLKRAMSSAPIRYPLLAGGIGLLSAWFFTWLGLLSKWDLSRLFPFEGLNPVMIVIGAAVFLKEKIPLSGWIAMAFISAGVVLVSMS